MRRLPAAIPMLAATVPFGVPAFARHSPAGYDGYKENPIDDTVAHTYLEE